MQIINLRQLILFGQFFDTLHVYQNRIMLAVVFSISIHPDASFALQQPHYPIYIFFIKITSDRLIGEWIINSKLRYVWMQRYILQTTLQLCKLRVWPNGSAPKQYIYVVGSIDCGSNNIIAFREELYKGNAVLLQVHNTLDARQLGFAKISWRLGFFVDLLHPSQKWANYLRQWSIFISLGPNSFTFQSGFERTIHLDVTDVPMQNRRAFTSNGLVDPLQHGNRVLERRDKRRNIKVATFFGQSYCD